LEVFVEVFEVGGVTRWSEDFRVSVFENEGLAAGKEWGEEERVGRRRHRWSIFALSRLYS
jgi:hypothetical protein